MFTCYGRDGTCTERKSPITLVKDPFNFPDEIELPVTIFAPVGMWTPKGNRPDDTIKIQRALNAILPEDRGSVALLDVDGKCGPKTLAAIEAFQKKHFGASQADRLIEPERQTINKINDLLQNKPFRPATLDDYARALGLPPESVREALDMSFNEARRWVSAAHLRLFTPGIDEYAERWFLMSKQRDKVGAYAQIKKVVSMFRMFLERPGGLWGQSAFAPEPVLSTSDDRPYAWCIAGGFYKGGEKGFVAVGKEERLVPFRVDSIYYTTAFIFMTVEQRAFAMVHEMGHFVSRNPEIRDRAYAHKHPKEFHAMPAPQRLSNTDHYTMFVYQSGTGKTVSPVLTIPQ